MSSVERMISSYVLSQKTHSDVSVAGLLHGKC